MCEYQSTSALGVCAYVRKDNPRALATGLSPVQTHNRSVTCMDLHFVHCAIFDKYLAMHKVQMHAGAIAGARSSVLISPIASLKPNSSRCHYVVRNDTVSFWF